MSRIIWCLNQKNGIKIIEPNQNLSQAYILKAEDSLKARIDVQYFVDKDIPDELYSKLIEFAPHILIKSKSILSKLTEMKINTIRDEIRSLMPD